MASERAKSAVKSLTVFFSHFRNNRDAAAVMLVGSIITLLVSIPILYISIQTGHFQQINNAIFESVADVVSPVVEVLASILLFSRVSLHRSMGGLGILMGIISLPGSEGGLLIGFILVVIGGIMSILYREPYIANNTGNNH